MTNRYGRTFSLYLLPATHFVFEGRRQDASQYAQLCGEIGLRPVTTGASNVNAGQAQRICNEATDMECLALLDSATDHPTALENHPWDWIVQSTGWTNVVTIDPGSSGEISNSYESGRPSANWDQSLHPVCGREDGSVASGRRRQMHE
eukprot:SAG22_NODE_3224_length_1846_cov_1.558100_1_plen_148_part_00